MMGRDFEPLDTGAENVHYLESMAHVKYVLCDNSS
jgi:hypothetical protein